MLKFNARRKSILICVGLGIINNFMTITFRFIFISVSFWETIVLARKFVIISIKI